MSERDLKIGKRYTVSPIDNSTGEYTGTATSSVFGEDGEPIDGQTGAQCYRFINLDLSDLSQSVYLIEPDGSLMFPSDRKYEYNFEEVRDNELRKE